MAVADSTQGCCELHLEIDVIPNSGKNTNRAGKSFEASARIYRESCCPVGQAHGIGETSGRVGIGDSEIIEADLARKEHAKGSRSGLELWTEQPVKCAEVGRNQFSGNSIGESLHIGALKVVTHFCLELDAGADGDRGTPAETYEIVYWPGIAKPEVFSESPYLNMV